MSLILEEKHGFDLNVANNVWEIPQAWRFKKVLIQTSLQLGTWTSGAMKIERSIDGITWADYSPAQTISAAGYNEVDVTTPRLRIRVSTAEGAESIVCISIAGKPRMEPL